MSKRQSQDIFVSEEELLADPSISDWLKQQIIFTKNRDVLDALNDSELLFLVLANRCKQIGLSLQN